MYNIIFYFNSGNCIKIERRSKQHAQQIVGELNAAHERSGNTMYTVMETDQAEKVHLIFMKHLESVKIDLIDEA